MLEQIGRYEVRRELGRGGMATVYVAYDPRFKRQVAIKVLPRQFTHDPKYLARFEQEAQVIATLEHPAIVPVYDFGEHNDAPYLVMRYMAGGSLRDRLRGKPLSLGEVAAILEHLAPALDKAHNVSIIHRDIKPANILFDEDGNPYLADFGIARLAEASHTMTVVGTPAYMSPEQVDGTLEPDGRADIYAFGVMLYELLSGHQPYEAETPTKQMMAHVLQPVPNILATNPELPQEMQTIIEKTMAKDRDDRYSTTRELADAFKGLLEPQISGGEEKEEAFGIVGAMVASGETNDLNLGASASDAGFQAAILEPEAARGEPKGEPPLDSEKRGGSIPGWMWWAGALALLIIVGLGLRSVLGGSGQTPFEDTPEAPVAAVSEEFEFESETPTPIVTEESEAVTETPEIEALMPVEVTRIVVEEVEVPVEVVITETPVEEASWTDPDPLTYVGITDRSIQLLDPNLVYDSASMEVIETVMEGLITFDPQDSKSLIPVLAVEVPSNENNLISDGELTYKFNIREGVAFHEGGTLEPHDVAYTFQRGLLQSDFSSPQYLLIEPIMGFESGDITEEIAGGKYAGNREDLIANTSSDQLREVCEKVKAAVVADDAAGTVTFNLATPFAPFLPMLTTSFGKIIDMEWAVEQGAWDGSCETWQDYYAPGPENSALHSVINGTGPFKMDNWEGEDWSLARFENYWRGGDTPLWPGGPYGPATLERIVMRLEEDWDTRLSALQNGEADWVSIPSDKESDLDQLIAEICNWETGNCTPTGIKQGIFRKWGDLPSPQRSDIFLNFELPIDSPYIGSGQLDGDGIPPNFFSDINVRKAFNYCFNYDAYIAEVQNGNGIRNNGPIIQNMLGYNENGLMYEYDPDECARYLETAWDGKLPETGFRFQIAYNTGNISRQKAAEILQRELNAINPLYKVEIIGLPWPEFLGIFRDGQFPVVLSGWVEDYYDPHDWVQPFTAGVYAARQNMPDELLAQFQALVDAGVSTTDPSKREEIYFELQALHHDEAPQITLSQNTTFRIEQPWGEGFYYHPGQTAPNYYAFGWLGN